MLGCLLFNGQAAADEEEAPAAALLEFLGQWSGEDMAWLDEALKREQDRERTRPAKEVKDDE